MAFFNFKIRNTLLLISSLGIIILGCYQKNSYHSELDEYFDAEWAMDPLWDDGLAEVAIYEAERNIYGKPRKFEYVYILVKEDFNKEFDVKTDDYERRDLFSVLKVNQFARIETDNYPYHFLSSLFYRREHPLNLHKATISSQEWCGNTFKSLNKAASGYDYRYNSYWDGEGEGASKITEKALFEDQLPYSLRSLNFEDGLTFSYNVLESQINNKAAAPKVYNASFKVREDGDIWKVIVQFETDQINEYGFEKEYPNVLVEQNTWDGRKLNLKSIERKAYWNR